jgi:talin
VISFDFVFFQRPLTGFLALATEFGLFLSDEDKTQGVWLEPGRNLGYYLLRNHDVLEYRRKLRTLRVRMLDNSVKTILVDDSLPVSQLMVVICTKIGKMLNSYKNPSED